MQLFPDYGPHLRDPITHTSTPKTPNFSPSSLSGWFPKVRHVALMPLSKLSLSHNPYFPSPPPTLRL